MKYKGELTEDWNGRKMNLITGFIMVTSNNTGTLNKTETWFKLKDLKDG